MHRNFIRRIERNGVCPACLSRFIRQSQAGKPFKIRWFKVETAERCQIKGEIRRDPLGVTKGIQDRETHVRHRDLREDAAVDILNQ